MEDITKRARQALKEKLRDYSIESLAIDIVSNYLNSFHVCNKEHKVYTRGFKFFTFERKEGNVILIHCLIPRVKELDGYSGSWGLRILTDLRYFVAIYSDGIYPNPKVNIARSTLYEEAAGGGIDVLSSKAFSVFEPLIKLLVDSQLLTFNS